MFKYVVAKTDEQAAKLRDLTGYLDKRKAEDLLKELQWPYKIYRLYVPSRKRGTK